MSYSVKGTDKSFSEVSLIAMYAYYMRLGQSVMY